MLNDIFLVLLLWLVFASPFVAFVLATSGSTKMTREEMKAMGWCD
jgi:hypothetical protein